jgi:hypothetical protein
VRSQERLRGETYLTGNCTGWQQPRRRLQAVAPDRDAADSACSPKHTSKGFPKNFPLNVVLGALWTGYDKNRVFEQCALAVRVSLVSKEWAEQVKSWQNSNGESFEHAIGLLLRNPRTPPCMFIHSLTGLRARVCLVLDVQVLQPKVTKTYPETSLSQLEISLVTSWAAASGSHALKSWTACLKKFRWRILLAGIHLPN